MNERIRELVNEANLVEIIDDAYLKRHDWQPFAERYTELIVRECVSTLDRHHPYTKDPGAYLYAISLIERTFRS
jgi:hypothetical protein